MEDCLLYLCASGYTQVSGDLRYSNPANDEINWHFNYSPQVAIERNEGNCGGNSGLVAYLLEGDYDEVGFACYCGRVGDGGHVINYLKDGDVYYAFDANQFVGAYEDGFNSLVHTLYSCFAQTIFVQILTVYRWRDPAGLSV